MNGQMHAMHFLRIFDFYKIQHQLKNHKILNSE